MWVEIANTVRGVRQQRDWIWTDLVFEMLKWHQWKRLSRNKEIRGLSDTHSGWILELSSLSIPWDMPTPFLHSSSAWISDNGPRRRALESSRIRQLSFCPLGWILDSTVTPDLSYHCWHKCMRCSWILENHLSTSKTLLTTSLSAVPCSLVYAALTLSPIPHSSK